MTKSRNILTKYSYWTDGNGNVYRQSAAMLEFRNPNNHNFEWVETSNRIEKHWREISRTELQECMKFNPPKYTYIKSTLGLIRFDANGANASALYINHCMRPCWAKIQLEGLTRDSHLVGALSHNQVKEEIAAARKAYSAKLRALMEQHKRAR